MHVINCIKLIQAGLIKGHYPDLGRYGSYHKLTPKEKDLIDNILRTTAHAFNLKRNYLWS